ncbi:CLUMA_CG016577, isoform A [Clunio marinus]|uniref:CLUMA_CG016577, isoform A n=1 Tax=Clunio marinus TaxID=568069 RepID=A0A1J1IVI7_9DIPT|nr:CLUMA_CG016577, isoform A [Clunio marinus]
MNESATTNNRRGSVEGVVQRCGLCSLLTSLLRRAMCVGSRRGSGESYYQELADTMAPEAITDSSKDPIYIRLILVAYLNIETTQTRANKTEAGIKKRFFIMSTLHNSTFN